jgi:hypothetical protein
MTDSEISRCLIALGPDDFMITIVNSALARGNAAPIGAVRSMIELIGAMSDVLNDEERAAIVHLMRDASDAMELPLLTKKKMN